LKDNKDLYKNVKAEILKYYDYQTCEILNYDIEKGKSSF